MKFLPCLCLAFVLALHSSVVSAEMEVNVKNLIGGLASKIVQAGAGATGDSGYSPGGGDNPGALAAEVEHLLKDKVKEVAMGGDDEDIYKHVDELYPAKPHAGDDDDFDFFEDAAELLKHVARIFLGDVNVDDLWKRLVQMKKRLDFWHKAREITSDHTPEKNHMKVRFFEEAASRPILRRLVCDRICKKSESIRNRVYCVIYLRCW